MKLPPAAYHFIVHWGEMGSRWGISRSVAQIHALLFIAAQPLPAEEIAETLEIARSNVSTGIKELQTWGLVRVSHTLGDRRDHFETAADVWEILRVILRERKRRELEPTLHVLRGCSAEARAQLPTELPHLADRLDAMLELLELADSCGERAIRLSPVALKRLAHAGDAIFRLVG